MVTQVDTRKFIVRTKSGSYYIFDNKEMTWDRRNTNPGHEDIRFMEGTNSGRLSAPVEPRISESLTFFTSDGNWVRTTTVVSIEEVF